MRQIFDQSRQTLLTVYAHWSRRNNPVTHGQR